ncbi:hypothetical protein ACS0TY_021903 [Phlomoides rotata]
MPSTTTFLCFLVLLCFVTNGISTQCSLSTLTINQTLIQQNPLPEWRVNITNTCDCTVYQLKFACPNFDPRDKFDPSILSKIDKDLCLINNGSPIFAREFFNFTYPSPRVGFALFDYTLACS